MKSTRTRSRRDENDDEEEYQEPSEESESDDAEESEAEIYNKFSESESEDLAPPRRRGRSRASKLRAFSSDEESGPRKKHLRERKEINYQILPPPPLDDPIDNAFEVPKRRAQIPFRQLFKTSGPFGGNQINTIFGKQTPSGLKAAGGVEDSDSSDDDMKPKSGSTAIGAPLIKQKSKTADSDPLGIDTNIDFSVVGGLDNYVDQLKEMVSLPLQYPEVYQRFGVTPPRGVLFHGPPGTGKTLMARALAASCSTGGRKVTFFMRKGADCLSKWVGEAERQLRLLFEEAKNQQPSIIFFDEIDGLAPVRSSKQEQIHASIVSTLLALMDGMDNRGQVIVIGATNRPDSVDSALRRPGRFDREFYFPLPDLEARKKIISIHTRKWDPPLQEHFVEHIARMTKGYGGADLRALCTEAALSAIQRRYPQIYQSQQKLLIDPSTIHVAASDFMRSVEKIVPSSARSTSSNANPLPPHIQPLLDSVLDELKAKVDNYIPRKKKITPLEEALLEDYNDLDGGFSRLEASREFQSSRVFRPRLLVYGDYGMGQQYLGAGLLHHLEGYHIQSFDLGTLLGDSSRTPEAMIIQLLVEVKRHTPSVIFIPNMDRWLDTISQSAKATFFGFLRDLKPTDSILVLALMETKDISADFEISELFGYSGENIYEIPETNDTSRERFFELLIKYIKSKPSDFTDPENRPKRKLEILPLAPPEPEQNTVDTKQQKRKDTQTKNKLKIKLSAIMDPIKNRYKKFKKPIIDLTALYHILYPTPDIALSVPYKKTDDDMILEVSTGRRYYNMDLDVVEERLWNGYYCEPKQFLADIKMIHHDSVTSEDRERIVRSSEMVTNAQVYIDEISLDTQFVDECKAVHKREIQEQERLLKLAEIEVDKDTVVPVDSINGTTNGHTHPSINGTIQDDSDIAMLDVTTTLLPEDSSLQTTLVPSVSHNVEMSFGGVPNGSSVTVSVEAPPNGSGQIINSSISASVPVSETLVEPAVATEYNGESETQKVENEMDVDIPKIETAPTSTSILKTDPVSEQSASVFQSRPKMESQSSILAQPETIQNVEPEMSKTAKTPEPESKPEPENKSENVTENVPVNKDEPENKPENVPEPVSEPESKSKPESEPEPEPEPEREIEPEPDFILDEALLAKFQSDIVSKTAGLSIERLEQVNSTLIDLLWASRKEWNRNIIIELLMDRLDKVMESIRRSELVKKQRMSKVVDEMGF